MLAGTVQDRADWTHYRGSHHNGVYAGPIRTNWTETPPRLLWRVPSGPALSSLTLGGGRVFTQARRRVGTVDREFAVALDATDGHEVWSVNLDVADYPHGGVGDDDGPRSTPVIDGERVYVLTSYLKLYCLDAATGQEIWHRDFPAELGSPVPAWQNAASPLVIGDLVILNANAGSRRIVALHKSDGTEAWRAHDEPLTHATPVAAEIHGIPQIIFYTWNGAIAVTPDTGEALWRFPFRASGTSTAASPLVGNNSVFCSTAYGQGAGAASLALEDGRLVPSELWRIRGAHQLHWASPVYHRDPDSTDPDDLGQAYGVFGSGDFSLRCVDIQSGTQRWLARDSSSGDWVSSGSVLDVGGFLLILSASGNVALAHFNAAAYREIDRFQAFSGPLVKCWNCPAVDDGILYARSTLEVAAFDLAPSTTPPPDPLALSTLPPANPGILRLKVANQDGTPVGAGRWAQIRLFSSPSVPTPIDTWSEEEAQTSLDDGHLVFEVPLAAADSPRFFLVGEGPQ